MEKRNKVLVVDDEQDIIELLEYNLVQGNENLGGGIVGAKQMGILGCRRGIVWLQNAQGFKFS